MAYEHQAWPMWLFKIDGSSRIFDAAEDVPEGEDWMTREELAEERAAPTEAAVIPEGWAALHWKKQASIAKAISGEEPANAAAAKAVIEAELARRGAV